MKYSDYISIETNFKRSTNIMYDTNCDSYILSTSSVQALRRVFITNTSNSIAITGPFGSGKSSFLIYLEALLSKDKKFKVCIDKLEKNNSELFTAYQTFAGKKKKGFFSIKVVGEHISFKKAFFDSVRGYEQLKETQNLIETDTEISFTLILKQLNKEILALGYTGTLFLLDELGKVIEYASEKYLDSDIHALQGLAEYVNKQDNMRLVVALHKSFKDYVQNTTHISFTEWDKIQGRFDNIVFQDDFYELMHIFEEAITVSSTKQMKIATQKINTIFTSYKNNKTDKNISINAASLEKLAPLHPFALIALFHIFSKHFQNQRSAFSFLSAQEPYSFQSFISQEMNDNALYTLDMLFDYINYLANAYTVNMVDKESWKLANEYLDSAEILTPIQQKIIKSIALVSAFGLEKTLQLDSETFVLALCDENSVEEEIKELQSKGLILYKRASHSFALIEETAINIDEALSEIIKTQIKVNYKDEINKLIENDSILAKRFYIETGTAKFFTKEFLDTNIEKSIKTKFKLIYVPADIERKTLLDVSSKNKHSIYIPISLSNHIKSLIDQTLAIDKLLIQKDIQSNPRILKLLHGMLNANKNEVDNILDIKEDIFFNGEIAPYSSASLQHVISDILQSVYIKMPIIINDLVNPLQRESLIPNGMKKLFEHMINNPSDKNIGIEKLPAQMAIYLSVIKRSGFHQSKSEKWLLAAPTDEKFLPIWEKLLSYIKSKESLSVDDMVDALKLEPYGLNDIAAKFVVFVFFIVKESNIHFFRTNTYQFDFDIDQFMDIWKNSKLYTVRWHELTKEQEEVFAKYIQIFNQHLEMDYSKKNIKYVFHKLFKNIHALPNFCRQTKELSSKAISLRTGVLASKEPHSTFFKIFPRALEYKDLSTSNVDVFINDFKMAFNEIVFSYKKMALELEEVISDTFDLSSKHYPFDNKLEVILEKYLKEHDDKEVSSVYRVCSTSNDITSFLNGLSLVLINQKVEDAYDHDIKDLKEKINKFANRILAKLDIIELIDSRPVDIKKLKISTVDGDNNLIMTVDKTKVSELSKRADGIVYALPNELTKDEKLYMITLMMESVREDSE